MNFKTKSTNTIDSDTLKVSPEYIWLDAFKGTAPDLTCRNFQFELGKQYDIEGTPSLCSNGFHCCKNLKDVFTYYPTGRYFKCKALVNRKDLNNISIFDYDSKYAAKSIILTEELTFEEFGKYLNIAFVNDQTSYNEYLKNPNYVKDLFLLKATYNNKLSTEFATYLFEEIKNHSGAQIEITTQFIQGINAEDIPQVSRLQFILDYIGGRK